MSGERYRLTWASSFYSCYRFQDIRGSKWVQHPKFWIFISCLILIVLFSFDSLWHFLPSFFNQIWTSSCDFRDKRAYMVPKGTNSQNEYVFYFMLDLYAAFLLNSFENFLFWICIQDKSERSDLLFFL